MSKLFRLPTILLGVLLLQAPFCRLGDSHGEVGVAQIGVIIFREWVFLRVGSGLNQKTLRLARRARGTTIPTRLRISPGSTSGWSCAVRPMGGLVGDDWRAGAVLV